MSFNIEGKHAAKVIEKAMSRALNRFFQYDNGKLDLYDEDWPEFTINRKEEESILGHRGVRFDVKGSRFTISFLINHRTVGGNVMFLEWNTDGEHDELVRWLMKRGYLRKGTLVTALTKDDARAGTDNSELAILALA